MNMRTTVLALLVTLMALPGAALGQSPSSSAAPSPSGSVAEPWVQAVGESGVALFVGEPVTPVALVASGSGITALVRDAAGTSRIWSTVDGATWVPANANGFDGRRLDGIATAEDRWLAWSLPADGQPLAIWTSRGDRTAWVRMPDAGLAPLAGAHITMIAGSLRGYMAVGTRRVGGRTETHHWISQFGGRWEERRGFTREHPGATVDWLGLMGDRVIDLGQTAAGEPMVWVANPTLRYVDRLRGGSVPADAGEPVGLVAGRDAGLIRAVTAAGTTELWRSTDAWTWSGTPGPEGIDPTGARTAWAGSQTWLLEDTVAADGTHDLRASVDALTWTPVSTDGAPTDGAVPLLAMAPYRMAMLTPAGIWTRLIELDAPRPIAGSRPVVTTIGADPPLGAPVSTRLRDRRPLSPRGAPSARASRDGVTLQMWLPDRTFRPGDWITAHVRITNARATTIWVNCSPSSTRGMASTLFDPGQTWTGNAAAFKERVLGENAWDQVWFGYQRGDGVDCPGGDVGQEDRIAPGASLDYDVWGLPRSLIGSQPLPGGRLPIVTRLRWSTALFGEDRRSLEVRAPVRLVGPTWPWPSPGEIVDAALRDPYFADWLMRLDPPSQWTNTTFELPTGSFYWSEMDFTGPAPDGTVHIGLFADSWSPSASGYARVLLDPWTAQVLGSTP